MQHQVPYVTVPDFIDTVQSVSIYFNSKNEVMSDANPEYLIISSDDWSEITAPKYDTKGFTVIASREDQVKEWHIPFGSYSRVEVLAKRFRVPKGDDVNDSK